MNYEHIDTEERYAIAAMRGQYIKVAEIAMRLGRHRSTIYRELKRNASVHDCNYRASHSYQKANGQQKRSKCNMRYGTVDFMRVEPEALYEFNDSLPIYAPRIANAARQINATITFATPNHFRV